MRILITGNMGYIGSVLVHHLRQRFPNAALLGFDTGYFGHCLATIGPVPETALNAQFFGDVRNIPASIISGCDAIVHLAAISNDPIGGRFEQVTQEVNFRATVNLLKTAIAQGVGRFVFASSCSVYGYSNREVCSEADATNPLTAYAKSKVNAEEALRQADLRNTQVTILRFATACGMSPRIRLDLVLNDFVACAIATRRITLLSDGSAWRPLIHVKDMARAIEWALIRENDAQQCCLTVNVGANANNFRVIELANAVATAVPETRVEIASGAVADKRSYRVDFSLYEAMAATYQPQIGLVNCIEDIRNGLESIGFKNPDFRNSDWIRLKVLDRLIASGKLSQDLRWVC